MMKIKVTGLLSNVLSNFLLRIQTPQSNQPLDHGIFSDIELLIECLRCSFGSHVKGLNIYNLCYCLC
ncbi:hypothetical protein OIU79_002661, partial [Salix purpurea]